MSFKTAGDVLNYALEKEIEAAEFYENLSKKEDFPPAKEVFAEFAGHERKHEKLIQNFSKDNSKIENYSFRNITDLKISDYLVDIEYEEGMPYNELLILAMKREEKAFKLYTDLIDQSEDEDVKKLFQILSSEEADHKNTIEKIYDDFFAKLDM